MSFSEPHQTRLNIVVPFILKDEPSDIFEDELWCGYARELHEWIETYIHEIEISLLGLNQAKVLLLDKYLEWRAFLYLP